MKPRVLVHADVELSAIDGSTSWLISVVRAFAEAGATVHVLARNVPSRPIVLDELTRTPSVRVLFPNLGATNPPPTVAACIIEKHSVEPYDMIVVRGESVAAILAEEPSTAAVLWYYIAALPKLFSGATASEFETSRRIARAAAGLFAQTEWLRDYLQSVVPESRGKTQVLPPMVPDEFFEGDLSPGLQRPLVLGYAGKFDKPWHALEIPLLAGELDSKGVETKIVMYGDKVQAAKDDQQWHHKMRRMIATPPDNVAFPGALPRSKVPMFMRGCDLGIGWRYPEMDTSYEISTKLLEFSASGVPVICNDTAIHRTLLGDDYPLFVQGDIRSVAGVVERWVADPGDVTWLKERVRSIARPFSIRSTGMRLAKILDRTSRPIQVARLRPPQVTLIRGSSPESVLLRDCLVTEGIGVKAEFTPRSTKGLSTVDIGDGIIAEWTKLSLEASAKLKGVRTIAVSTGSEKDRGLVSAHRLQGVDGVVARDARLLQMVRSCAPRCRTFDFDVREHRRSLVSSPRSDTRYVSLVLYRDDLAAVEQLENYLRSAVDSSRGLVPVRIVVLQLPRIQSEVSQATASRFQRVLQTSVVRFASEALEVLSVKSDDPRWLTDSAVVVPLGTASADLSLQRDATAYRCTLVLEDRSVPRSTGVLVANQLRRETVLDALQTVGSLGSPKETMGAGLADFVSWVLNGG